MRRSSIAIGSFVSVCALAASAGLLGCSSTDELSTSGTSRTQIGDCISQDIIGPNGGQVGVSAGPSVSIPPGALLEEIAITISSPKSVIPSVPPHRVLRSKVYAFEPHALPFSAEAVITLPHDKGSPTGLAVLTAEPGGTWQRARLLSTSLKLVRVRTSTFSYFVVVDDLPDRDSGAAPAPEDAGDDT